MKTKWAPALNGATYILCHVRRVNDKKYDDNLDDDNDDLTPRIDLMN